MFTSQSGQAAGKVRLRNVQVRDRTGATAPVCPDPMIRARPYRLPMPSRGNALSATPRKASSCSSVHLEYHASRFVDASMVLVDDDDSIAGALPASRTGRRSSPTRPTFATHHAKGCVRHVLEAFPVRDISRPPGPRCFAQAVPHIYHACLRGRPLRIVPTRATPRAARPFVDHRHGRRSGLARVGP